MQISGSYQFDAPAIKVWEALLDPTVTAGCIPGCDGFDPTGDHQYQTSVNVNVGPINGHYTANLAFLDQRPHQSFTLSIEVSGPADSARGKPTITLTEQEGKTTVQVAGDAQIGGMAAMMGPALLGSAAHSLLNRFFGCLRESVER